MKHTDAIHGTEAPIIIFSIDRPDNTDLKNQCNRLDLIKTLADKHINFKRVRGAFNGRLEVSYIVPARHEKAVRELCAYYRQSCYMLIDQFREAFIKKRVTKAEALEYGAYTIDTTGQYWSTKSRPSFKNSNK